MAMLQGGLPLDLPATGAEPGGLRVRLLGGFEVWRDDRPVAGFESQKVRALFAYLACQRDRSFSRDHLSGLLWPDREPEAARHALRQALYNLRSALAAGAPAPLLATHRGVQIDPAAGLWTDVAAFEEAVRLGKGTGALDPHFLTVAAQLYRGELLAGFFVKDSEPFEDWLRGAQERLREMAIDVLRTLVEIYQRRGEYRFGLHYARRLASLEPLSEEACRDLMRLSRLAGQRSRALAEYERLQSLLHRELSVEPLKETRDLYESILLEGPGVVEVEKDTEPVGPLIPLAGRGQALAALLADWQEVRAGRGRVTLVTGGPGTGKTRLVKTFLDAAAAQQRAVVLKGDGDDLDPPAPYGALVDLLSAALHEDGGAGERALALVPAEILADLSLLCPGLAELRPGLPRAAPLPESAGRRRLTDAVAAFLGALGEAAGSEAPPGSRRPAALQPEPLVLFLDDLHRADPDTLALLKELAYRLAGEPVWLIAACHDGREEPLLDLLAGPDGPRGSKICLDPLSAADLREIAESLVTEEQAVELGRFLAGRSSGLPLEVAELINFLWDEGLLAPDGNAGWRLTGSLAGVALPGGGTVGDLILHRVRRLPSSTRRLATLAAVAGASFDFALLEHAGEEHPVVIEVALELLLRRWLLRQSLPQWEDGKRRGDLTLWEQGMRRGRFEFAHRRIRTALTGALEPRRRQILHAQVAAALEALPGTAGDRRSEILAHHWAAAGDPGQALSHLERVLRKARALQADATAIHYYQQAHDLLGRLSP